MAVVDKVAERRGTAEVARAYLEYLYSDEGQDIAGRNYLPPAQPGGRGKVRGRVPQAGLFTVDEVFGGWAAAQKTHFADGGVFDQIYQK